MSDFFRALTPIVVQPIAIVPGSRDDFAGLQVVESVDVDGIETGTKGLHFKFASRKAADSASFAEEKLLVRFLPARRIILEK